MMHSARLPVTSRSKRNRLQRGFISAIPYMWSAVRVHVMGGSIFNKALRAVLVNLLQHPRGPCTQVMLRVHIDPGNFTFQSQEAAA